MNQHCASTGIEPTDTPFDAAVNTQFALCDALEALADSLPSRIDTAAAMRLARYAHKHLRRCHALEETEIFPDLLKANPEIAPILARLRDEHVEDEDHTFDLRSVLRNFERSEHRSGDAEEIGYMLRCLFTSLRRHVAFERDHLLPLYRRICAAREQSMAQSTLPLPLTPDGPAP